MMVPSASCVCRVWMVPIKTDRYAERKSKNRLVSWVVTVFILSNYHNNYYDV